MASDSPMDGFSTSSRRVVLSLTADQAIDIYCRLVAPYGFPEHDEFPHSLCGVIQDLHGFLEAEVKASDESLQLSIFGEPGVRVIDGEAVYSADWL